MSIAPTCVEDINFRGEPTMSFSDGGKLPYTHLHVYRDEFFFLNGLSSSPSTCEELAYAYYRKIYVYHDRFGNHMPVSIRKVLLQAIADSL